MSDTLTRKNRRYVISFSLAGFVALFLAIAPVLDPYILAEFGSSVTLRVNDVFAIILALLCFCKRVGFPKNKILLQLCLGMTLISLISMLGVSNANVVNQIKVLLIWFIYAFLVSYIWNTECRETFFRIAEVIALFAIAILLIQFVLGNIGVSVWDGKIPLFNLSKYDGWAGYIDPNTGDIRPNSIFQEPSYFGIYILVLFAHAISNNRIKLALLYAISTVLTTSLVAVLGMIIITMYYLMTKADSKGEKKTKRRVLFLVILFICIFLYLYNTNDYIYQLVEYIFKRVGGIQTDLHSTRMGSTRWRLMGNINLFSRYTTWQKLFGYGTLQYASIFGVVNYSSNFVNVILNYGIIGLVLFVVWLARIFIGLTKNRKIFFWVMIIIFAVDQQWFSWYFFYLLSACVLLSKEKKGDMANE
ncbi:MAG: hypothetical protein K6A23_06835 [Butyrivibrio sp.]|nr:hypothetical protein [Butyrivibrio sp.]